MNSTEAPRGHEAAAGREHGPAGTPERLLRHPIVRAIVRFPLFYKVVLGNALLLIAGMLAAVTLAHPLDLAALLTPGGLGLIAAVLALSVSFNALLVYLALLPLRQLENTAARVREGDLAARAPRSPLADRRMEELVRLFNHMLDSVEALRRRHRRLTVRVLESEERQRTRVADRLYDETAQALAAVLLRLRVAGQSGAAHLAPRAVESLRTEALEALAGVQRLARELRPPEISEVGLIAALEAEARSLSGATGVAIRVRRPSCHPRLERPVRITLFRVLQEALGNAVRHSGAHTVEVRLEADERRLRAEVVDDGVGFDPQGLAEENGRGLGLFELYERVAHLGGSVTIESAPGRGTRLIVEVPIDHPSAREPVGEVA